MNDGKTAGHGGKGYRQIDKQAGLDSQTVKGERERGMERETVLFVCLVGFLTSSSTTGLYCGRAPRQSV